MLDLLHSVSLLLLLNKPWNIGLLMRPSFAWYTWRETERGRPAAGVKNSDESGTHVTHDEYLAFGDAISWDCCYAARPTLQPFFNGTKKCPQSRAQTRIRTDTTYSITKRGRPASTASPTSEVGLVWCGEGKSKSWKMSSRLQPRR